METKVNYAVVGAFVLVLAAAIAAGVLWLGSGGPRRKGYTGYVAYFTESVSGLHPRAPVKDRGVDVGSVREISLDPVNPEQVRVLMDIERHVPIKEDSVATLAAQGLTGIAHIELSGGSNQSPPLKPPANGGYPVIQTAPSLMLSLDESAGALIHAVERTVQRIDAILDEPTQASFRRTIGSLDVLTASLARHSADIEATLDATARTTDNAARASAEIPALVDRISRTADALTAMAGEVGRAGTETREAAGELRRAVQGAGGEVNRFGAETLPELNDLLVQLRETATQLTRFAGDLQRSPNALVLGKPRPIPGPGE